MMQHMMGAPPAPGAQPATATGNPMQAMMQQVMNNPQMMQQAMQMMSNPQMMQQMMQMRQAMGMGAPGGGMFGNLGLPAAPEGGLFGGPAAPAAFGAAGAGATDDMIRAQFAAQLSQLVGMGFTNEALCLQALR